MKSCVIDGEAIVVDQEGLSVFDLLRYRRHDHAATLCAFDLVEVDGNDLRRHTIEDRKWQLSQMLRRRHHGVAFNETYTGEGAIIYRHACSKTRPARGSGAWRSREGCWVGKRLLALVMPPRRALPSGCLLKCSRRPRATPAYLSQWSISRTAPVILGSETFKVLTPCKIPVLVHR